MAARTDEMFALFRVLNGIHANMYIHFHASEVFFPIIIQPTKYRIPYSATQVHFEIYHNAD